MARDFVLALSQYFSRASPAVTSMPLSMACWYSVKSQATNFTLMSLGDSAGANGYQLSYMGDTANDPIRARHVYSSFVPAALANTTHGTNEFHHAAATFTSITSRRAYADGVVTSNTTNGSGTPVCDRASIGVRHTSTLLNYLDGVVAWPTYWNVVLTQDEISALAAGLHPWMVRPQNVVHMPLFLARATDEEDWVAGGVWTNNNVSLAADSPRIIMPPNCRVFLPAAAATFNAAWNIAANSVIHPGAIAA